jgi:hypothetical protein
VADQAGRQAGLGEPGGRAQRLGDQRGEKLADVREFAVRLVQPGKLGVGPEAAARQIDGRKLDVGDGSCLGERPVL